MANQVKNEVKVEIAELLKPILADQYLLYTKVRNYHWNITGDMFYTLHAKFEDFYNELADDVDEVAERIRALGVYAPGTMSEFTELSGLKDEQPGNYPDQITMAKNLINDFEFLTISLNNAGDKIEGELNDRVTVDLLNGIAARYEKNVWMLKSLIESK
jgi:starvation-inducible DNA-binding protein